jgi:plastocyanin
MNETLFYVFGIALILSAVVVSAIGLRFENFPATRAILAGTVLYFAVLVGATAIFAVLNARDEQQHREAEQAAEETTSTTEASGGGTTSAAPSGGGDGSGGGAAIKLAADPSQIAYTTTSLSAQAGNVTIDFDNPNQAIPHDVCVDSPSGDELGCSDIVTGDTSALDLSNLKPGKYTFFCSVDSHQQAGMEGTLTVQ